jgi:hypothetical protein
MYFFADLPESKEATTGRSERIAAASNVIVGSRSQVEHISNYSGETQRGDNYNGQHGGPSRQQLPICIGHAEEGVVDTIITR